MVAVVVAAISQQCYDEGADASINDGGGSSNRRGTRVWGTYWTVGSCKRMVMEYCGNGNYNKRLVTIGEAFVELEKYVVASDHNTFPSNMLHMGSLPQIAGWNDWLQLVRLLHGMMVCTSVVAMCLKLGVEDDAGQITSHSVNNTGMQLSDIFLLDQDDEDLIGRMVSTKYDADVLVDRNGSIKWHRRKKKQL